jgi:Zn-dependent alcohol dehydrogenase
MRAAILEAGRTELTVVDDLEVRAPGAGEIAVDISFCGLCHSDLGVIRSSPTEVPIVLGHEAAGTVAAVGVGVHEVKPGDKVVLTTKPSCGRCHWCAKGRPTLCEGNHDMGLSRPLPNGTSGLSRSGQEVFRGLGVAGFAERNLTAAIGLTRIPDGTPLDIAAVLGCAVRTGVGSVINTAKVAEGESMLVMGLGGIGQSIVMGGVLASASPIIVSDPFEQRRKLALELGATVAVDPTSDDLTRAVREATQGRGVDYAFDAAGSPTLVATGFALVSPGGAVVVVGASGNAITLPTTDFVVAEKRVLGSLIGSSLVHRDVPRFLEMWQAGRLPLDLLITGRRPIEEINAGFEDMEQGRGVRTVVAF